jgi:hypothetical protein
LEAHAAETVLAVEEKFAVFAIAARADVIGKIAVVGIEAERKTFVAEFRAVRESKIHRIFCADDVLGIKTILRVVSIESHVTVFTVIHIIAHAILAIGEMRRAPRRL